MLRSNQEEQIKYFYLDRKFGSGNLREVGDALDDVDLLLGRMKKIDLINSLVMRMLDLIQTAKSFHIKERVSGIFRHHSAVLLEIHSKDEVAAVLAKCLKGSDQYTRIIAMQMVATLTSLFRKDIAVYHTLLSKISASNHLSKEEKTQAIVCLTGLLSTSRQLSKLFTKNITEIQEQYDIHLHVIIYLLTYVTIDSHLQKQILEEVLSLIMGQGENKESKKQIYYYEKLVMNYATCNYRIVELYESKLKDVLPRIQKAIAEIKAKKYPFMKNAGEVLKEAALLKVEDFIDELYERKKEGNRLTEYQVQIHSLLLQTVRNPEVLQKHILLAYFFEEETISFDQQILSILQHSQEFCNRSILKKLLTIGLFKSSRHLLERSQLYQSNYMVLKCYIQLKICDKLQALTDLIQIAQILNPDLHALFKLWQKLHKIFIETNLSMVNESILSSLFSELSESYLSLKQSCKLPLSAELEVISIILHHKNASLLEMKGKCYYILPSSIMQGGRFWFAFLDKRTILSLFKTML